MSEDDLPEDLDRFETSEEAFQYLKRAGMLSDTELDLGETALALGLALLPGVHAGRYRQHLRKLSNQTREEFLSRLRMKEDDTLEMRARTLRKIIHEAHNYAPDDGESDLESVNFIRVIERRKGAPAPLGLLYTILARGQGWETDVLDFPSHLLVRLEQDGKRLILDPFLQGREMNAAELRQLLKFVIGEKAELAHAYYSPLANRTMLLRLQNTLKKRLIEQEEYAQAIVVIETMEALAPQEHRTLFDKGVLYVKIGQRAQAIDALERYIEKTPSARDKQQAQSLLQLIHTDMD